MQVGRAEYDVLLASLAAAKNPNKWKGPALRDASGQRTTVRCVNGLLVNWSLIERAWLPIVPADMCVEYVVTDS